MKNLAKEFKDPGAKYRGKPFWSWNGKLEVKELERQIDVLKDMGMGGYFCHSRTGLATEYLGEEWFELINACAAKGKKEGMETWLYDEDRWPSGTAGGIVTKNRDYRIHYIRLNVADASDFNWSDGIISAFTLTLDGQSFTNKKRIYGPVKPDEGTVVYFTSEEMVEYSFYNGETYVDTMNPEATAEFIRVTHDKYAEKCSKGFNNGTIRGIFTDEPHHGGIMTGFALQNPEGRNLTPYPKDLFKHFYDAYGYHLEDNLPELYLFPEGEMVSKVKWHYCDLICSLYIKNYLMPLRAWCKSHNIEFTGHLLHEDSLAAQASVNGSMQRGYEHMDSPGVDVLWEFNFNHQIAKQLQSSARQLGKTTLLSELYGCSGWQMTFQNHKAVGDWQSLYGINLRCHHLCWYTMKGEAKRDYPGSIFYQSEWYKNYKYVEDYFSRIHVLRDNTTPVCDTLIMSPVESLWSVVHPGWCNFFDAADPCTVKIEQDYVALFKLLESNQIDFDFGDEEQMSRLCSVEKTDDGAILHLGNASYRTLIIPTCLTMRSSTVKLAREFALAGGSVIFLCKPQYVDAVKSSEALELPVTYTTLGSGLISLLNKNPYARVSSGKVAMQVMLHSEGVLLHLLNLDRENGEDNVKISFKKDGYVEKWDVRSGKVSLLAKGERPEVVLDFAPSQEYMLMLKASSKARAQKQYQTVARQIIDQELSYCLTEPNVAVLDIASYSLDGSEQSAPMEILKLDREVRTKLGLVWRNGEMLQPWFKQKEGLAQKSASAPLKLTFKFNAEHLCPITLMMETPELFTVKVNDITLSRVLDKTYIDPCFKLLPIDADMLKAGENTVTLEGTFNDSVDLEAIYLLGGFGVKTDGVTCCLTKLPQKLRIGDITTQGLPFYSGSIDYLLPPFSVEGKSRVYLSLPKFEGALATVHGNSKECTIAFAPYTADVTELAGDNAFVRLHLTRRNTFGPMHMNPVRQFNYGPDTFHACGKDFMYDDYSLIQNGILEPIELEIKKPL
ncbi:MAG: hypothetical protein IKK58_05460 [Clostridia bacterium]|nr:hypothetical protein [Clostridia bacterium]